MGLRFSGQELGSCFYVTTSFYERQRLGDAPGVYGELAKSLKFCLDKTHSKLPGFVFMPTHIHLLMLIDGTRLAGFVRDFKKFTAQQTLHSLQTNNKLWQDRYDRLAVWSIGVFRTKLNYIHNNPVKSGLVDLPEDWPWSSAREYFSDQESSVPIPVWRDW